MSNFKYEDWLQNMYDAYGPDSSLCHFNQNHDPKSGKFTTGQLSGIISNIRSKRKAKKEAYDKWKKDMARKNEIINYAIEVSDDFIGTKEGQKLKAAHDKAYDEYFNSPDGPDDQRLQEMFVKAERDYLSAMGRYEAKALIEKFGPEATAEVGFIKQYKNIDDLIKKYGDEYVYTHGV